MDIQLGIVTNIVDPDKFIITFSIADIIQDMKAYPIDVDDQPQIGDPIVLFGLESIYGYSYLYKKQRLLDYTRMKLGNSEIAINGSFISITTKGGNNIVVSADGDLAIHSNSNITISSKSKIKLDSPQIEFPSGKVSGEPNGPFNSIPICPFTKQPHGGNILMK